MYMYCIQLLQLCTNASRCHRTTLTAIVCNPRFPNPRHSYLGISGLQKFD